MNRHRACLSIVALAATSALVAACDENPGFPKLGSMAITTTAPAAEREFVTTDGWSVKYDRFLVHVTAVNVAGTDQVLAASATPQIIDQVAPGPKTLLSATLRVARAWEDVSFQIGPAAAETDTTIAPPVKEADRDMMQKDALALYVEGKASKAGVTKSFKWGFGTDTLFTGCQENRGGTVVHGLVVPPDGNDTADIVMSADVLFSDDVAAGGLRADAITAADTDNDGTITLAELRATPLDAARATGAAYATGDKADVTDLGAFVEALVPRIATRFRASGTCMAAPAAAP
ncbi:MAG: putative lipoprotein [Labilithrix sp.]|nr:putative lipoprotein [Labilithrix sp.]